MAMIQCHECGKDISDSAEHCPHCGCKTNHGKGVTQVKMDIFIRGIIIVAALVGGFLVVTSWSVLRAQSSYYWESGYWRYDEEIQSAFMKMFVGLGALIGSIIAEIRLNNQIKYRTLSEIQSAASPCSAAAPQIKYSPTYIPEEKRKHGTCAKCGSQGLVAECKRPYEFGGDFDLCPICITRYNGKIR